MRVRIEVLLFGVLGAMALAAGPEYTVSPGETLSEIAAANGTTTEALTAENGLSDPDRILAGQGLMIPNGPTDTPAPVATSREDIGALIERTARAHGWNPAFVQAIAWQESGWDPGRTSSAGAIGVMQVMPATGAWVGTHLVGRDLDLRDPEDNVLAGVVYLQHLWERTGGDVDRTLAGYYQGLRSVAVNGRYHDTERYIANVLALRDRFG